MRAPVLLLLTLLSVATAAAALPSSSTATALSDLCGKPWRKVFEVLPDANATVFSFSRVVLPRGSRLIVKSPPDFRRHSKSFGAIEPDSEAECRWAYLSRTDAMVLDYVPPAETACDTELSAHYGVTIDVMNMTTFCANTSATGFGTLCHDNYSPEVTTRAVWGSATCAKGKTGWQESPLDDEVEDCKRQLVSEKFDSTASAWGVEFAALDMARSGQLVVEAVHDPKINSSAAVVHKVLPLKNCTWQFAVAAPGFRVFYEPPARCTEESRSVKEYSMAWWRTNETAAAEMSSCASPSTAPNASRSSNETLKDAATKAPSSDSLGRTAITPTLLVLLTIVSTLL
ncbi:hypothetical protein PINS_up009715 [Pythium insidiosum]|nr:hypothetical protein PINS_up009715 [Pythium insidiosum]